MLSRKFLYRAARRLRQDWCHAVHAASEELDNILDRLDQNYWAIQQARRRLDKSQVSAETTGQSNGANQLATRLQRLRTATDDALAQAQQPAMVVPSAKFLLAELRQIDADFGGLQIDANQKFVAATTDPITLESLELGPFAIRFFWERLKTSADYICFDIVALDPRPAGTNEEVTHPHVKDQKLCTGDATIPIRRALQEGRLADAFTLIRGVLGTYNPSSPYVSIENWDGISCNDCGYPIEEDDANGCDGCGQDFCGECISYCNACDHSRCTNCLMRCAVCERSYCSACLQETTVSERSCCSNCRHFCPDCQADFAADEREDGSELCPDCRATEPCPAESDPVVAADSQPALSPMESNDASFPIPSRLVQAAV